MITWGFRITYSVLGTEKIKEHEFTRQATEPNVAFHRAATYASSLMQGLHDLLLLEALGPVE